MSAVVVQSTATSEEEATRLAHGLVRAKLAACVQITPPIRAVYRWKGEIYDVPEWQLWIKTEDDKVTDIVAWLPEHHSNEVPEVIVLPVAGGWSTYLDWITAETRV